jgi:small multidrug resistance family-3 protein
MTKSAATLVLLFAAILEAGGDALVRHGLKSPGGFRWSSLLAGAAFLIAYGVTVNAPDWDFGRLLGLYVVFFFVVAQLISWLAFNQIPSTATLAGGALIVAGGLVIGLNSPA